MNLQRVIVLARRVVRQIFHDRRTLGLVFLAPMMILTIGALLFRFDAAAVPLGVVNDDQGMELPVVGQILIGQRIVDTLSEDDNFDIVFLTTGEVDAQLRDGTVQGVLLFPEDFSSHFVQSRQVEIDLRLEGSNPTRSRLIQAKVTEASMKSLAGLASAGMGLPGAGDPGSDAALPVTVSPTYVFGGELFDTVDYIAPVYIAFLAFFFVFLLTCVSFLRERSQGTMERLLATPATRLEIILGYMAGLSLLAVVQVTVILFFTIWVLEIHYLGSIWLLLVVVALLAIVGVTMGILASTFARNEFQVVQFIPLAIIPQALLGGMFIPVHDMPIYLRIPAYFMPLTYANSALLDIMLKGSDFSQIWLNMLALIGFSLLIVAVGARTMRREVV